MRGRRQVEAIWDSFRVSGANPAPIRSVGSLACLADREAEEATKTLLHPFLVSRAESCRNILPMAAAHAITSAWTT
jgi:hypothetical protein